jgi:predicted kinase
VHRKIVLVSGPPGAGKTTLATGLAPLLGVPLIAKDLIKETLWDALEPPDGDLEWSRRLGAASMELLWALAGQAPAALLEANFRPHSSDERTRIAALSARVVEIYCSCPPELASRRYAQRAADPSHHRAHVRPTLSAELLAEFDQPVEIGEVIVLDTSGPVDLAALADQVRARWP